MSEFWGDLRFGFRLLARSPVFALTVSLLLGIGIGANTLIFSIVDTLLLRPLPVKHPEQLVRLIEVHPTGFVTWDLPYVLYEQLASNSSSLSEALCEGALDVAFEDGASTERIRINAVSRNFFSALGIQPVLGRVLGPEDDRAALMYAVLSYDFWQKRFGGSASVVGRNIRLNGRAFTVVGGLPKGVNGLTVDTSPDLRVPLTAGRWLAQKPGMDDPASSFFALQFQIFGRLRPGISLQRAEAEIEPLLHRAYEDALIRALPEVAKGPRKDVLDSRLRLESVGNGVSSLRVQFSRGLVLLMAGCRCTPRYRPSDLASGPYRPCVRTAARMTSCNMTRRKLIRCSLLTPGGVLASALSPATQKNSGIRRTEQEKRAEAFRQAEASLRLSGLQIDSDARRIFERYISGELTLAGMGTEIDALQEREFGLSARGEFVQQPVAQIPQQRNRPC